MLGSGVSSRTKQIASVALAGAATAVLLGACGGEVDASGDVAQGEATGKAIEVVTRDNEFKPETLQLEAGDEVTVEVTNEGDAAHNFTVESLDLSTGTIEPGDVATATFTVGKGATEFVCTIHPGMQGRLEVATAK